MSDLTRIIKLAELLVQQQKEVKESEERLKSAKAAAMRTEREDLPTLMAEIGLAEITLSDGSKVIIKEDCDAKLTEATRERALAWLASNNYGGLIKTSVSLIFPRGARELAVKVRDELCGQYANDAAVDMKEDVHHSTLKAFVKERMASGEQVPMDLFNVYPYSKAVIKGAS